jgi:hypothetical protein
MIRTLMAVALFATLLGAQHRGIGAARGGVRGGGSSIGIRPSHFNSGAVYYRTHSYGPNVTYRYGPLSYESYYYPFTQVLTPAPRSANGGPVVIVMQAPPQEDRVVYVPSWLRPNPGPSLGEIARQLGARPHKHPVDKIE